MTRNELITRNEAIVREMQTANDEQYQALEREFTTNKCTIANLDAKATAPKAKAKGLVEMIREAMANQQRSITVDGYTPQGGSAVAGVHDAVVPTDIQGILDPLYTESALAKLGVRFYPGLVHGDVRVPVLGKNTVNWSSEIAAASGSTPSLTAVTLKPKRLTAYVDISRKLLLESDGIEASIKKDLAKAIQDKLEATIFGYGAGDSDTPAGMFASQTLGDANTFAKLIGIEAGLEDACVTNCKYLLSPKAKATLRTMATNGNGSPRAFSNGEVDGTMAVVSANVIDAASTTAGAYIYGAWDNLAVGSWGNVEIGIYDDSTTAVNGVVRLVVNAYFDVKVLRAGAFAYGDVRHA